VVSPTVAVRPLESAVWAALHDVHDPEIPTISVVDLGVVGSVETAPGAVRIELLPTFIGCPAVEVMRACVEDRLRDFADDVAVDISFSPVWTTDRITETGRSQLRLAGFAPPTDDIPAECPFCGSRNTSLENAFGPTLCRAIYHCNECRQPFEQFKLI
jgi:ring-1,2-phenylacetyl-CoA epoxidase subunit PaaD